MRTPVDAVALAGQGADQFGDAGRVGAGRVHVDGGGVEAPGQGLQAAADELGGTLVVGQVDAIEQVGTVAGVRFDWQGPTLTGQPAAYLLAAVLREGMLAVVSRNPGGAAGVDV